MLFLSLPLLADFSAAPFLRNEYRVHPHAGFCTLTFPFLTPLAGLDAGLQPPILSQRAWISPDRTGVPAACFMRRQRCHDRLGGNGDVHGRMDDRFVL